MVAESGTDPYSDTVLGEYIERYPVMDSQGEEPTEYDTSTDPPTEVERDDTWIPTYDLNRAAADIWAEKAATVAADYDFSADGANLNRSQPYQHCRQMSAYYASRARVDTIKPEVYPPISTTETQWLSNRLKR